MFVFGGYKVKFCIFIEFCIIAGQQVNFSLNQSLNFDFGKYVETVEGLHIATPRKNAILLVSVTVISLNSRNFFLFFIFNVVLFCSLKY